MTLTMGTPQKLKLLILQVSLLWPCRESPGVTLPAPFEVNIMRHLHGSTACSTLHVDYILSKKCSFEGFSCNISLEDFWKKTTNKKSLILTSISHKSFLKLHELACRHQKAHVYASCITHLSFILLSSVCISFSSRFGKPFLSLPTHFLHYCCHSWLRCRLSALQQSPSACGFLVFISFLKPLESCRR